MGKKAVFSGSLDFLSLGDILQLLGSNSSTGVLRITSKHTQTSGLIYLQNGNPINAANGSLSGLDAVYSLFGWLKGEFEFTEEQVTSEKVIKKNRMEIILNSLSMLDDGVIEKIGPPSPASESSESSDSSGKKAGMPIIKGPLVDYIYVLDEEEFSDGSKIVVEGKHGNWLWVILEGVADIVKDTPRGPVKIVRIGEGMFIGSVASFLMGGNVRSATVVAVGDVQLGVIDSQRLSIEFSRMSHDLRGLVTSFNNRLRFVTDSVVKIKQNKNNSEELIKGKKIVIKQGRGDEGLLFAITKGEACIVRHMDNGIILLDNLYGGDFFGHVPFFDIGHEPYSASVYGSKDLKIKTVDVNKLEEEYDRLSSAFKNIIKNITTCVSVTTMVACESYKEINQKIVKNL